MKNYLLTTKRKSPLLCCFLFFFFLLTNLTFGQTTDTYTASGSWTVPAGVTSVTVQIWGAGGGGGGSDVDKDGGSGGGSGAYVSRTVTVSPGTTIPFTIGIGGTGGTAAAGTGGDGGNSSITIGGFTLTANGGTGGAGNEGAFGNGGTASGGTTSTPGNNGETGGNSGGDGGDAPIGGTGGAGGTNGAGGTGNTPGGGGGGGELGKISGTDTPFAGGAGARGEIRFTYTSSISTNFTCATATNLPCGTTNLAGTTVGSTGSTAHGTGCSMSNYGAWYTFVGDGQITTISTNPAYDIELSVVSGNCGSFTNIVCTDSSPETATFSTILGTTYYVYIASWSSGSTTTGTFTISRSCSAPIGNDNCAGAVSVPVNPTRTCTATTAGTIFGATDSGVTGSTCGGTDDDDVWFSFVATASTHYIELLNVAGNTTDLYHAVYSGACGALGAAIVCSDPDSSTVTGLTPGNTYYIQIYSWGSTTGRNTTFDICISTDAPCSGTPTAGTVSVNPNTAWPGASYVVSATGYPTNVTGLTFQWQYSTDGGTIWNNAGAATGTYADYNATAPASGDVHWQLVVTCTNIGQSATSVTGVFVTMEVSDVVTGCPNVVSGGFGLNGADPAPINCTSASTCVDLEATYLDLGNTSSYIVEPILYNPPFAFNGLANPVSVNTDDVWSPIINLPFDFCFYGNTYTQCTIGSNGILTFDTSRAGGSSGFSFSDNIPISGHSQLVENAIFGVFHDINPGVSGEVGWELITLTSGCRALVASWYNVPLFGDNSQFYTGMMVLYENSNIIEVYIQNKPNDPDDWNDNNAIVGIQNSTGTLASVAPGRNGLDPDWTATNEAWRFVPNGTSITTIQWYEGSGTSGPVVGTTDVITVCPGATTTYTAEITYTLCDGTTIVETDETTVTVNGAKTWDGSVNTNWNNANNWTPVGVPTIADCVLIPVTANDPIISGASYQAYGLNLTIDNGATLTINSNNSLTIDSWINIATGGDLVIQNAASLVQINNNTNTGIIHMDRDAVTTSPYDYVYWSSPVDNFSVDAITPTSLYKYQWIPTVDNSNAYDGNFGNWSAASGAMNVGQGYIVRGSSGISTFEGVPNNGIINTPIERSTYAGADYSGPTATMVTENDDNWNLLGNPYPSAIDAIDFITTNTNIDGFVKIWTHGTLPDSAIADPFYDSYVYNYTPSDYITFNSSGTLSGPGVFGGYIAAGQGFFVLMNHTSASTSETVTFDNSMRSDTFDNSQFFKTSNTVEKNRIWLDLIDANNKNVRALVGYITDATNERDRLFDAITDKKLNFNLYSFTNSEKMTIQGRTLPFNVYDLVPMGVAVPADGNYKIAIGALDGLFENNNQEIYIEDLENGIIHNLRETPYNFTATKGNTDNRFVLRYTNNSLSNEDFSNGNTVSVYSNDNLIISSSLLDIKSVRIYDILGRSLANFESVDNKILTATGIQKNNNAIIVQITLTNGNVINKKVIY